MPTRRSSALSLAFAVAGCLVAAPAPAAVKSLLEMRHEGVVMQQWDISCGAAAIATVLTYQHGDPVPEKTVAEAMLRRTDPLKVRVRLGFSLLDMKRFVESRGYVGIGYGEMTVQDLEDLAPVIVPIQTSSFNHFVVFRGRRGDRVSLADPAFGNRAMTVEQFEEAWVDNIGFVVKRSEDAHEPNRIAPARRHLKRPQAAALRTTLFDR